jgi:hydrogenase nickel insertion protein HypA
MHEMGIVSGILTASVDTAARKNATAINEIVIRVGELTEIAPDALDFAFEALSPGTLAEGAKLTVIWVEPRSKCHQCGTILHPRPLRCDVSRVRELPSARSSRAASCSSSPSISSCRTNRMMRIHSEE